MLGPSISDSGSAFERVFDRVECLFNSPGRQEREAGESGNRRSLVAIVFYKQVFALQCYAEQAEDDNDDDEEDS